MRLHVRVLCLPVACKPRSPVEGSHRRRSHTSSFKRGVEDADDAGEGEVSFTSVLGVAERLPRIRRKTTGIKKTSTAVSYFYFCLKKLPHVLGRTGIYYAAPFLPTILKQRCKTWAKVQKCTTRVHVKVEISPCSANKRRLGLLPGSVCTHTILY